MKERPIIFNGEMVRAILDGRKTQTRRVFKKHQVPKYNPDYDKRWSYMKYSSVAQIDPRYGFCVFGETEKDCAKELLPYCPYGKPGDRLWVRETWRTREKLDKYSPKQIMERCKDAFDLRDGDHPCPVHYLADDYKTTWGDNDKDDFGDWGKTRASIHMPRWASRIDSLITDRRAERVQDISEYDSKSEGVISNEEKFGFKDQSIVSKYKWQFMYLWDSINKKRGLGWDENPWAWVIEFELI